MPLPPPHVPPPHMTSPTAGLAPPTTRSAHTRASTHAWIQSGRRFADTSGQPVHAHGAGVLPPWSHPQGSRGKVYLVGTAQKLNVSGYWLSEGINLYSSFDLEHWAFEVRARVRVGLWLGYGVRVS